MAMCAASLLFCVGWHNFLNRGNDDDTFPSRLLKELSHVTENIACNFKDPQLLSTINAKSYLTAYHESYAEDLKFLAENLKKKESLNDASASRFDDPSDSYPLT